MNNLIHNSNKNVNLNGSVNDTYKHRDNSELNSYKHQVINELKTCNYRTPPRKIALLLEKLLYRPDTKPGHWLFIAQKWPPRAINRNIYQMIKAHQSGWQTINNPAAYFTKIIKYRKPRKSWFRNTNDTYKQQV
jgi:hypothetical protein